MLVHFVRHGESLANVRHVMANRGAGPGLTDLGRQQVRTLAGRLRSMGVARLLASPLTRARQTAEILADVLRIPVEVAPELREFDCGEVEGRDDAAAWAEHMSLVRAWLLDGDARRRIAGGESLRDIRDRFVPFVTAVCATAKAGQGDLIFVGHAGLFAAALPSVLPEIEHAYPLTHPIGKAGRVLCEWRAGRLHCLDWNGTPLTVAR